MQPHYTTLRFKLILFFLSVSFIGFSQTPNARYTVTFMGTWNSMDHGMLPSNDHWSNLVGATHNSSVVFWEVGQLASSGIEDVAEVGNNDNFEAEVNTAIGNNNADQWLREAFNPNNATGSCVIMDFIVNENFPLLTLATMIAPSPDWFTGINSYSLLDGSNNWKNNVMIDMFPFDAGTEDGTAYDMSNPASNPQVPIFSRINMTPFNDQRVGYILITLEELLSTETVSFQEGINISPNPASNRIHIFNGSQQNLKAVQIYDLLGNLVQTLDSNLSDRTISIERNGLSAGMYLIKLTSDEGQSLTKKLIFN
ncbi:MAG: spondin domain-containing protein [Bacteroidia bacterium]|nr:spondin domain-containing protein [Bacteroidia bacterium]